eukprot:scaffold35291_cov47-Attheya_sp.AAC.4
MVRPWCRRKCEWYGIGIVWVVLVVAFLECVEGFGLSQQRNAFLSPMRTTRLQLFFPRETQGESQQGRKSRVPPNCVQELSEPSLSLPFRVELLDHANNYNKGSSSSSAQTSASNELEITAGSEEDAMAKSTSGTITTTLAAIESKLEGESSSAKTTLWVRQLRDEDLAQVVQMCVLEFGSQVPEKKPNMSAQDMIDYVFSQYENAILALIIWLGLSQRIQRRVLGDDCIKNQGAESSNMMIPPDHNVVCLSTGNGIDNIEDEVVLGIAEVSLQPLNPERSSPPYVLSHWFKEFMGNMIKDQPWGPYVSNVLVRDECRGAGYSKLLMASCEGLARQWGYDSITLHVDADMVSGEAAQGLYKQLGYKGLVLDKFLKKSKFQWMGPEMANLGLYMVEGIPLLYLQKKLNNLNQSS